MREFTDPETAHERSKLITQGRIQSDKGLLCPPFNSKDV